MAAKVSFAASLNDLVVTVDPVAGPSGSVVLVDQLRGRSQMGVEWIAFAGGDRVSVADVVAGLEPPAPLWAPGAASSWSGMTDCLVAGGYVLDGVFRSDAYLEALQLCEGREFDFPFL